MIETINMIDFELRISGNAAEGVYFETIGAERSRINKLFSTKGEGISLDEAIEILKEDGFEDKEGVNGKKIMRKEFSNVESIEIEI